MSLPENATSWPLQQPPTYLSTLEDKLCLRVSSADDFHIPDLSVLHKKSKQIQVIREVRNSEVKCFTQMEEDIEHWLKLLQLHQPGHNKAKGASFVIDSQ